MAELRAREPRYPHRIRPVRCLLENHRDDLLAFARQLDQDLGTLAEEFRDPRAVVKEARQVRSLAAESPERWVREKAVWQGWGSRYGVLREALAERLERVVRASSVIENLNS